MSDHLENTPGPLPEDGSGGSDRDREPEAEGDPGDRTAPPGRPEDLLLPLTRDGGTPSVLNWLSSQKGIESQFRLLEDEEDGEAAQDSASAREDKYSNLGEIARGGMGVIVKVLDNDIGRPVAMKIILGDENRSRVRRFVEEAQVTGRLEHPNIVPVHEMGVTPEGRIFFTMKLVRGRSLEDLVRALAEGDEQLRAAWPLSRLLDVFVRAAEAVAFAHSKGVIHRDLKPENVMVGSFGEVMVMDWGLAKIIGQPDQEGEDAAEGAADEAVTDADAPTILSEGKGACPPAPGKTADPDPGLARTKRASAEKSGSARPLPGTLDRGSRGFRSTAKGPELTREGEIMGTPAYMPPEQAAGRRGEISERSDVFSLGGILYRLLAWEHPYVGDHLQQVLLKAMDRDLVPPRRRSPKNRIPAELESICLKAMAKEPAERYASAEALVADVRAWLDRRLVSAHRYGPFAGFLRWVQRHPATGVGAAVALLFLCSGAALTGILLARAEAEAARAREQTLRAEAEVLRAEKAEKQRARAEEAAAAAVSTLEKGRLISAVQRAALLNLDRVRRDLDRLYHSGSGAAEKREKSEKLWPSVVVFERSVPGDSASRATWLAIKGWLSRLAGREEESFALFREASETDPDVAYGALFEAMAWLSVYFSAQAIPSVHSTETAVSLGAVPGETELMVKARESALKALEEASRSTVWGEEASGAFLEVIEGFRGLHSGDFEKAEKGLTRALGIPEMAWLDSELLLVRARLRCMTGKREGGLEDARCVLERLPWSADAWIILAVLLYLETFERQEAAAALAAARESIDAFGQASRADPGQPLFLNARGLANLRLATLLEGSGSDPIPALEAALSDFNDTERVRNGDPNVLTNRARVHLVLAQAEKARGADPQGFFLKAAQDASWALRRFPAMKSAMHTLLAAVREAGPAILARKQDPRSLYQEAERACDAYLENHPGDLWITEERGLLLLKHGFAMHRLGLDGREFFTLAIRDFDRMAAAQPEEAKHLFNRGLAWLEFGSTAAERKFDPGEAFERAVGDFTDFLARKPQDPRALANRGLARSCFGGFLESRSSEPEQEFLKAVSDYEGSLAADPGNLETRMRLAAVLMNLGDAARKRDRDPAPWYLKAAEACRDAGQLEGSGGQPWAQRSAAFRKLAELAARSGKDPAPHLRAAAAAVEEAVKRAPTSVQDLGQLSILAWQLGDFDLEISSLESILRITGSRSATVAWHLARARSAKDVPALAAEVMKAVQALTRWDQGLARQRYLEALAGAKARGDYGNPAAAVLLSDSHLEVALMTVFMMRIEGEKMTEERRGTLSGEALGHLEAALDSAGSQRRTLFALLSGDRRYEHLVSLPGAEELLGKWRGR